MMVSPMDYGAMIGLNIIIHNKEAILMTSTKSDGSLVTNKKLILIEASLIDVEHLMVRNILISGCIGVVSMYFCGQISALTVSLRRAILITSGSTSDYIFNLLTFLDRLRCFLHMKLRYVSMTIILLLSQIFDPYIDHNLQLEIFFLMILDSILKTLVSY